MITYNDIYEFLRKERYSEQLQPLPKKLVYEVANYISEKKKISTNEDMFSDEALKFKKQLENTIALFKELMLLRRKKLLGLVFVASETGISKRDFDNMLDFEKELFDNIMASMEHAEKNFTSEFNSINSEQLANTTKLILFLDDVDEFVDHDGRTLGPYKKDDIVNLPRNISDILIDDKKAEAVIED